MAFSLCRVPAGLSAAAMMELFMAMNNPMTSASPRHPHAAIVRAGLVAITAVWLLLSQCGCRTESGKSALFQMRILPDRNVFVGVHEDRYICVVMAESDSQDAGNSAAGSDDKRLSEEPPSLTWLQISRPLSDLTHELSNMNADREYLVWVSAIAPDDRVAAQSAVDELHAQRFRALYVGPKE